MFYWPSLPDPISWVYGQEGVRKVPWVNGRRIKVCVCAVLLLYWCICSPCGAISQFFKADTYSTALLF